MSTPASALSSKSAPVAVRPYRAITGSSASAGQFNAATGRIQTTAAPTTTLIADAVVSEHHTDRMEITNQPVEAGAVISDHAYKLPAELELEYAWSAGSPQNRTNDLAFLKNLYQQFLGLEAGAVLCTVNTGKRIYQNMLIKSLSVQTDKEHENDLTIRVEFQEILIATTQIVPVSSAAQQSLPTKTAPTLNQGNQSLQPATNFNTSKMP